MTAKVLEAEITRDVEDFLAEEAERIAEDTTLTEAVETPQAKEIEPKPVVGVKAIYLGATAVEFPSRYDHQLAAVDRRRARQLGMPLASRLLGR